MAILQKIMEGEDGGEDGPLNMDYLPTDEVLVSAFSSAVPKKAKDFDKAVAFNSDEYLSLSESFILEKGLSQFMSPLTSDELSLDGLLMSINGRIFSRIGSDLNPYQVLGILMSEQRTYVMDYMMSKIDEKTDFQSYIFEKPDVLPRFSSFLSWLSSASSVSSLQYIENSDDLPNPSSITVSHPKQVASVPLESIPYLGYLGKTLEIPPNSPVLTAWLFVDPSSKMGRELVEAFSGLRTHFEMEETEKGVQFMFALFDSTSKEESGVEKKEGNAENVWEKLESPESFARGSIVKTVMNSLGLKEGGNYLVVQGVVIPVDHLSSEGDAKSVTSHDIWSLLSQFMEESSSIALRFDESGLSNNVDSLLRVSNILFWRRMSGHAHSRGQPPSGLTSFPKSSHI